MTTTPHNVGDQYAYAITILNTGANSDSSTLTVNLPAQTSYNGAIIDRGPGCSASGQTVTCRSTSSTSGSRRLWSSERRSTLWHAGHVDRDQLEPGRGQPIGRSRDRDPESHGLEPGSARRVHAADGARQAAADDPGRQVATLSISKPKKIHLSVAHPSLGLAVKASGAATFTIELVNSKGKKLAGWTKHVRAGTTPYSLRLPPGARHAGHDLVVIKETGNPTRVTRAVDLTA